MAKIRVMSNQRRVGRVGDTTYYVRDGEQIARQSKNNSNYGEGASRTSAQMIRRVKWANLVNLYKACKFWMPKAFEGVKPGQTMYNKFMQLNINESQVALTKDMAQSGCCVPEAYQISKGSLPMIAIGAGDSNFNAKTSIVLTQAVTASTTIGEFSTDVINNNEEILEGDNLAFIFFRFTKDGQDYPYTQSVYKEVTLKKSSTALLSTVIPFHAIGKCLDDYLGIDDGTLENLGAEFTVIRTRKVSGSLQVSTAFIYMNGNTPYAGYIGQEWYDECIATYGLDQEVPLDPNFNGGVISRVTANGAVVSNDQTLNGSQELRVYYNNSDSSSIRLFFNGVLYTPLFSGDGYIGFILGDNGYFEIYSGDSIYMVGNVTGITTPSELPVRIIGVQSNISTSGTTNEVTLIADCLNYPYKANDSYPNFTFYLGSEAQSMADAVEADFDFVNCELGAAFYKTGDMVILRMALIDSEEVAYIKFKDFIVAVFNYTN